MAQRPPNDAAPPLLGLDPIDRPMRSEQEKESQLERVATTLPRSVDVPYVKSQYSLPHVRGSSKTREGVAQ